MSVRTTLRIAALFALVALGACDSASNGPFPPETTGALASLTVTANPTALAINSTGQFTAVGRTAEGVIVPATVTWSVETAAAGSISASGLFTAGPTVGNYAEAIRATSGSISGTATVNVMAVAPVATTIRITPNPSNPEIGTTEQFVATGLDATGTVIALPGPVTWSIVNGGGTIGATTGLFTAGAAAGTFAATVRAESGTLTGTANVTVSPASAVGPSFGTAQPYAILAGTAVSCIGSTTVAGNIGVAPAGSVSGFPAPCLITAPGNPLPEINTAAAVTAQADVAVAFAALGGMPCGTTLSGFDLGGLTLAPGVYCFTSSAQLTGTVTLAGPANGLWVFQIATALTTGTSARVALSGGAQAKNVFWRVGTSATLGQTTAFRGNIVAGVSVTMVQGATLTGRALSLAGMTMDGNAITLP